MKSIFDKNLVDKAFEEASPRPIRELMIETYPDAVEDCNGRFHAPHDGYMDPITDQVYRGGEYLPMEEIEDPMERAMRSPGSSRWYPRATTPDGEVHAWEGTRGQQRAALSEINRQHLELQRDRSNFVGQVGSMMEFKLKINHIHSFVGYYGTKFTYVMEDTEGNVIIYKGSKVFRTSPNRYLGKDLIPGDTLILRAKVKGHSEYREVKQTVIERPKMI